MLKQYAKQASAWVLAQPIAPKTSIVCAKWQINTKDMALFKEYLCGKTGLLECKHNTQLVHKWTAHVAALQNIAARPVNVLEWALALHVPHVFDFVKHVASLPYFHTFPKNVVRRKTAMNAIDKAMLLAAVQKVGIAGVALQHCVSEYAQAHEDILELQQERNVVLYNNRVWAL